MCIYIIKKGGLVNDEVHMMWGDKVFQGGPNISEIFVLGGPNISAKLK